MCQNKLQSMNGAIIPIITKIKASDEINLYDIKTNIHEIFKRYIDQQKKEKRINIEANLQKDGESKDETTGMADLDLEALNYIQQLEDFFSEFAEQCLIYDPLDRNIFDYEDTDRENRVNTQRSELLEIIN